MQSDRKLECFFYTNILHTNNEDSDQTAWMPEGAFSHVAAGMDKHQKTVNKMCRLLVIGSSAAVVPTHRQSLPHCIVSRHTKRNKNE